MTSVGTNLPNECIPMEAVEGSRLSADNSSHLSAPTVEENKDFPNSTGEEAEEIVLPEKPASAYVTAVSYTHLDVYKRQLDTYYMFLLYFYMFRNRKRTRYIHTQRSATIPAMVYEVITTR